jgi:homoserine dehydrogenase
LGFGVVGQGVAELLTKNAEQVKALVGDELYIKYILDLRDFPDSPFADRVIHDFNVIKEDASLDPVIEVMGGSHPAFEFSMDALRGKKHVITSNKQVVAEFGAEMLAEAKKNGACYHFEASVGGGIPVLMPIIEILRHNKVREVRGILNGTTNYILTKMFTFGDTFEASLKDAQQKGYAESNPDADILGIDACRKTAILGCIIGTLVMTVFGTWFNAVYLLPAFSKLFGMPLDVILGMGSAINAKVTDLTTFVIFMVAPINIIKGVGISILTMLIYKKVSPIIKYGRTMSEGSSAR